MTPIAITGEYIASVVRRGSRHMRIVPHAHFDG